MKGQYLLCILVLSLSTSVLAQPSITSFTPASGPVGTAVTINGSGFSATPASNIVYFGATKATVTAATTTQLTVTVPVGATYQPISVLVSGLIAYSALPFATTYMGWGVIDANTFVTKTDYVAAGLGPLYVATGDFDGDGKTDLAVANGGYGTVSILRNTSTGIGVVSYAAKIDLSTGASVRSVSIGDLDGDGKVDLVVTNSNVNTVSIFRNTSTGIGSISFAVKIDYATGSTPYSVAIGDLDKDGKADLAIANNGSNTVSVLRNTSTVGAVSFAAKVDYATATGPYSISIADLDNDGKVDVAVTNYSSTSVSVIRNTSTGIGSISFAAKVDFGTGTNPASVSIGDLDGDGKADLAVANRGGAISILLNTSSGAGTVSFSPKVDVSGVDPISVSIGDLDGDGKGDLAVANYSGNSVSVFRNTSSGPGTVSYAAKVDFVTGTNTNPFSACIGDFDGDGKADLATANYVNLSVILHQNGAWQNITSFNPFPAKSYGDAPISLSATASSGLPVMYTSSNTSVATVSGNTVTMVGYGTTTITATQSGDSYYGSISVSQLLAVGPFPTITSFTPTSGSVGTSVTITGSGFSATLANNIVYFGATKATVTAATTSQLTVTVPVGATYQPISVMTNGLLVYSKQPFSTTYVGWGVVDVNTFTSKTDFATGTNPNSITAGDFDGDGKTDLAVANYNSSTVSVFRNISTGIGLTSYAAKVDYATGGTATSVSAGDFDGDGKMDLALTNYNGNSVSIFRNTSTAVGSVSFATKVDFATGLIPFSVSIGDLDNDGKADLAVANYSSSTLSILRNTGTGIGSISFAPKMDYTAGANPTSVSIADLDGDGKLDVAVANGGSAAVSIFRNTSTGMGSISFASKVDFATGSGSFSVSIGDFDGDGKADLATTNNSVATISLFRNTSISGTVSFAAKVDFATGTNPRSISIGDLDGDGKSDLAVANYGDNSLSVLRNTSTGTGSVNFASKVDYVTGTNTSTISVTIGDFDGDGKADLATANYGNATLSVILHPTGARQTIASFNPFPTKSYGDAPIPLSATASSGLPVTYTSSTTSVATISGNTVTIVGYGTTTITASQAGDSYYGPVSATQVLAVGPFPTITSFTPTSGPVGTSVTINGSGFSATPANNTVYFGATKATVTAATAAQLTVTVPVGATYQPISVLTNGLITYSQFPFTTTYPGWSGIDARSFASKVDFATGTNPNYISVGDFDGDGKADLAVTNANSNTFSVFRNTSSGAGVTSYAAKIDYPTGTGPIVSLSIGDFDDDGKVDLAIANFNSNTVSIFRNTSAGPGSVSFAAKVDYTTGTNPRSVSVGDLDGDGKVDLVVANYGSAVVSIFKNTSIGAGSVSFAAKVDYATGTNPFSILIGDLDSDGKPDMAVANFSSNTISIFRNTSIGMGSVGFAAKVDYATGTNPSSISIGDLDRDGKADLAVANYGSSIVSVLRNTSVVGSISFAARVDYTTKANPYTVSIGDLDGDGKADLAVAQYGDNSLSVFQNTSTAGGSVSYAARVDYAMGTNPISVSIGDFDGDGRADMAVANYGSATMSVILHITGQRAVNLLAFQYRYDGRKRMTAKKVPGADWVYMVYDNRDRLVLTQDGNQRTLNQWAFTKYDILNRPILTGVRDTSVALTQAQMQGVVDAHFAKPSAAYGETYVGNVAGNVHGYSNKAYPVRTGSVVNEIDPNKYVTVTYYDNYSFRSLWYGTYTYLNENLSETANTIVYNQPTTENVNVVGKPTGSKTKVLDGGTTGGYTWLKNITYYDDKYRVVQTLADNYKGGTDRITNVVDFVGKVLKSKTTHVEQDIAWTNVVGASILGNKLSCTTAGFGNSGAASRQQLSAGQDGWMEVICSETGLNRMIGLSSSDPNTNYTSISYAWYQNVGILSIYENGTARTTVGSYVPGDILRIERTGTTIKYYQNGVLKYTSTVASSTLLMVDAALNSIASTLVGVRTSFSGSTTYTTRRFQYDHAGRLKKTFHQVGTNPEVLLAQNTYNEIGQLVDKGLYSTDGGTTVKQSVDYRYNIRGWLQSMNNSQLTVNSTNNDDSNTGNDLFGMELGYDNSIGSGNSSMYNGNISGMKWSTNLALGTIKDVAYNYSYDPMNRITGASYLNNTSGTWANATNAFNESGYTYDLNGNIKSLLRKGSTGNVLDSMYYGYGSAGNQLFKVKDSGDKTKGFVDGANTGNDYTYDVNGNMVSDQNKSLTATNAIQYNYLNLPQQVTKSTNEKIIYTYDASGRKLMQQVYNVAGALTKATDYDGEFIYQGDTLQFINHEEGRIVMRPLLPGENGVRPEYQYHLKDHLGNVRVTFTTAPLIDANTATYETANANVEQNKFVRYTNARRINAAIFDHTNGSNPGYSERLNGSANEIYGLARSISVMPGDVISAEVYAKYVDTNSGNWNAALSTLMGQIAANTAGVVVDGTAYATSTSSFPTGFGSLQGKSDNGAPKAYLNWLVFDRNYVFQPALSGFKQITTVGKEAGSDVPHEYVASPSFTITQPGYVYIYLSNENPTPVEVYFDDFKVTQNNSPVVQQEDFYPFGLKFNSYSREGSVPNTLKLFQDQEHIDDLGLNWDSFKWRNHQPDIGRFFNVDPLSEKYYYNSPYAFSENKVVAHRELEGLESEPINKEPGIVERVAVAYFMLLDKIGGTVNERNGNDNPSFNQNVVAATNLISDVVLTTQAHGEIMNSSGNSSNSKTKTALEEGKTVASEVKATELSISKAKYPEAAAHAETAMSNGVSNKGVIDRGGAAGRRREALSGVSTQKGKDRDEFPPAVINNGGNGSSVQLINPSDNRGAGASLGNQIKKLPDGTPVTVVVKDK